MSQKAPVPYFMILVLSLTCLVACGVSKDDGGTGGPLPDFGRPRKNVDDKDTLTLKTEDLKLTHVTQAWKLNELNKDAGAEKFLKLQKRFNSPIQFDGWVSLDRVEHRNTICVQGENPEPVFLLEDDHGGSVILQVGEKVQVSLEKLYNVRAEFFNDSTCKSVDVEFGILYGTNE